MDSEATARVALGVARAQSAKRRVVIGDLLGDAPPIRALVTGDDPYGLVDSFEYGVSLNQWIAAAVAEKVGVMETAQRFFAARAAGGGAADLVAMLRKAPDREPAPEDRLPRRRGTRYPSSRSCSFPRAGLHQY